MASTLPDFTALGAMPLPVSGRAIAKPDTTAIGQGIEAFGRGISQLADSVQKGWAAQEGANAQSAYLDFLGTQDQKYTAAVANLDPANAKGFAASATTDYLTASKQFLDSLPADQRQAYGDKVFQDYQAKSADALKVEQNQQTAFAKSTIAKSTDGLQRGILVDPTTYDSAVAAGDELIQMSALPPDEKLAELHRWHQNAAIIRFQAKAATDPQGALEEYKAFSDQEKASVTPGKVDTTGFVRGSANAAKPGPVWGTPGTPDFESQHLTTIKSPTGQSITVNKVSAAAFAGFLGDLAAAGYKVDDVEGYNDRSKLAGGPSQHAFGNAIDINPGKNPASGGQYSPGTGTLTTDLPANIADIAAKWGITWGGDWKSLKDPMHFEFAGTPGTATEASVQPVSYINNIPSDKILPLLSDASALAVRQQTALQQQQAAQAKAWNNAAENAVQDGTFGLTELNQAVKDGTLTDAIERKQLYDMITARDKDGINLAAAQGKFSDNNYTFNPFDATDKKAVDSVYKAIGHNGAGLLTPPEAPIVGGAEGAVSRPAPGAPQLTDQDILAWTVKRTGIVPSAAVDKIEQGIYSPDQTSRDQAFQMMDALSQLSPGAYGRAFTAEDQKRLGVYQALAALVPQEELDKALAQKTPQAQKEYDDFYQQGLKHAQQSSTSAGIDIQTFINAAGYQNSPTQPTDPVQLAALRTDYENAYAEAYASVHDEGAATKLAAQWVAHKWGPTNVGNSGSVLTPYPPEKYYPTIGGDQHWMATQLHETVTAQASDAKSWGVVPSPQTAVEVAAGALPSYNVWYQDASGAFRLLPNPMRFDPKSAQEQAVADFKAKHAAAIAPPPPPSQLDIDHGTGGAAPLAPGEDAVPAPPRTDYGPAPLFQTVPPGFVYPGAPWNRYQGG